MLIENGYENSETILNEWNYVKGWTDEFKYSIKSITSIKGAAFIMACISEVQKCDALDMLMYYDTRPSAFCGAFDFYTYEPLKGYYPLMWYGKFYDMKSDLKCETSIPNIYTLCGIDENNKRLCVVTHYTDDDNEQEKEIAVDFDKNGKYEIYLLDEEHDGELIKETNNLTFTLKNNSCILIKEI